MMKKALKIKKLIGIQCKNKTKKSLTLPASNLCFEEINLPCCLKENK